MGNENTKDDQTARDGASLSAPDGSREIYRCVNCGRFLEKNQVFDFEGPNGMEGSHEVVEYDMRGDPGPSPCGPVLKVSPKDIAIGDTVWWLGRKEWGAWMVISMHYRLNDGRPAASVIPESEYAITDRERHMEIAPLDELRCLRDSGLPKYSETD